jgi:hypothetical protein
MEQLFSTTTFWTWDRRRDGKLGVVKPSLVMLGMTRATEKTSEITIIFSVAIIA